MPEACKGPSCACIPKRVRFARCASRAPAVVHLSVLRSSRSYRHKKQVVNKWWYHLERLSPDRFANVRNGSCSLSDALLDVAKELQRRGEWSLAIEYMRLARVRVPRSLKGRVFEPDSHVTIRSGSTRAEPVDPAGPEGWRWEMPAPAARTSHINEIVFYATGALNGSDVRLLRHYSKQLDAGVALGVRAQLWLMLMTTPSFDGSPTGATGAVASLPTFVWSERGLQQGVPGLAEAFNRSLLMLAEEQDTNHARYYFFHASLLLWYRVCGHLYPRLRFVWRLEPDVVYSGGLSSLLQLSSHASADLLLPAFWSYEQTHHKYKHWNISADAMRHVPHHKRVWSLVSISRLSRRFLTRWLAQGWRTRLVYEEISMPRTCLLTKGCTLGEFGVSSPLGRHLIYKPAWSCDTVLRSRKRCEGVLYHPVKDRSCLVEFLDGISDGEHDSTRVSCLGPRRVRRARPLPPPLVLWVGDPNGSSPQASTDAGAEAGVPASAERRAASMMFGGNWGPGTRHILTVNGTMLNYG